MACGIRVVIWDSGSIVRAQKDHKTFFYPCNPCDDMHTLISKSGIAGSHTSHAMQVLQWKEKKQIVLPQSYFRGIPRCCPVKASALRSA